MSFLFIVALIIGMVGCDPYADYIKIYDWTDLDNIRNNLEAKYVLMNNLDSTTAGYTELASPAANGGKGWQPIGNWTAPFTGTLEGQRYEICDLFIGLPLHTHTWVGLFGAVDEGGRIEDIGVVNADVTGFASVGGLVGEIQHGTVSNSYATGSVTGVHNVGGLVGYNRFGIVSNSYATSSVTGYHSVGGLIGANYHGTVSDSYSIGSVTGDRWVGGLVGDTSGYSVGDVEGIISNSYYNYDEVLINGENIITIGALFYEDFDQWLANDKFLDVNDRLSQEDGYYVVNSVTDFKELLAFGQDNSLKFRLKNDLDLATEPDFYVPYLAGEFDGNGHKISNLSFNFDFISQVGLFGYLTSGGKVTDLGVENINITGFSTIGGLVGANFAGSVSNSYSTGNMTSYHYCLGGLVGWNGGNVSNSYSTGKVTGAGYVPLFVGGLVGINGRGNVINSYFIGSVTGFMYAGGLVGQNKGPMSNCYSRGSVTGDDIVGGLVGQNKDPISNCYSTGNVTGNMSVGGLVGSGGDVSNSYSTGSVTGNVSVGGLVGSGGDVSNSYSTGSVTGNNRVGGLVGESYDTVSDSYSTGSVTGNDYVGGLVGVNGDTVNNSYSTGSVTGNDYVGGLVGYNYLYGNNGTISSSFWDMETSGQATSDGGTGKTTEEMQGIVTFSGVGWNIVAVANPSIRNPSYIWNIVDDQTYPFLSWQPVS